MPVSAYVQSVAYFLVAAVALFASAGIVAIATYWVYLAIFAAVFILLTETKSALKFEGIQISNISYVLMLIPPCVGYLLIQVVDSLYIRERYIRMLDGAVSKAMPAVFMPIHGRNDQDE